MYTLSATSASSSLQRLATFTSQSVLKASRSWVTSEPKNSGASSGLVDHHGHALGLYALHDALDGARAEVVGVGLHRQAVDAHDRLRLALVDAIPHHLQHLVGDEVLAGAVCLHDGLDQVLGHVLVVREQLLGVLGQAVAAVAEAGVVVVAADARLQARVVDDVAVVKAADLTECVELVEVDHAEDKEGVGPSI